MRKLQKTNVDLMTLWTVADLARFLRVSEGHIYNLKLKGKIPYRKPGKRLYFFPEEIVEWINSGGLVRKRRRS